MIRFLSMAAIFALLGFPVAAQPLSNPGFEQGFQGWAESDENNAVSISKEGHKSEKSLKIKGPGGTVQQAVTVTPNTDYKLTAHIKGAGLIGVKSDGKIYFDRHTKSRKWKKVTVLFNSGNADTAFLFAGFNGKEGRFDSFILSRADGSEPKSVSVISKQDGGTGLSPDLAPGQNFDLLGWYLGLPTDADKNGKSDIISGNELAKGYNDPKYFYTAPDGGMVFRSPIAGAKTTNTTYTRTELRQMLRRGDTSIKTQGVNKNNWVFSTAPIKTQREAGAIDGVLEATLAVNHVTTTGQANQVGRVIIGQIHAMDDEPIRLYYRKLPGNVNGTIYAAHENPNLENDIYYEIIGTRSQSAPNEPNGIPLNAKFSYKIDAKGDALNVTISRDGRTIGSTIIDMSQSGYDAADEYMYFKAGVYNQNKSGDYDDYVQATFYDLKYSH